MFDLDKLKRVLDLAKIRYRKIGDYIFVDIDRKATIDVDLKRNQVIVGEYLLRFHSLAKPFRVKDITPLLEGSLRFLTAKGGFVSLWQNRRYRFKSIQDILKVICQHL